MPLRYRQAQVAPARGEAWKGEEPTFLCEECSHWEHEESTDLCIILIVSLWRKKNPVHGTNVSGIPSGSDRGHHVAKLNLAVISHVLLVGFGTIIVIMSKLSLGFLINSKKSLMFLTAISMHQNYHTFILSQNSKVRLVLVTTLPLKRQSLPL